MKICYFILFPCLLFIIACRNDKGDKNKVSITSDEQKDFEIKNNPVTDNKLFLPQKNVTGPEIKNNTNRKIDLMFNSIDGFLDGKEGRTVKFNYEWMRSVPLEAMGNSILFGKRMLFQYDSVKYFGEDTFKTDKRFSRVSEIYLWNEKFLPFKFSNGSGSLRFDSISCNDANYTKVTLVFPEGSIEIKNVLNAGFFEHDLDENDIPEQYIRGYRNCSGEFVLLRIREK